MEDEVLIARDKTKLLSGGPSTGGGIDVVEDDVEDDGNANDDEAVLSCLEKCLFIASWYMRSKELAAAPSIVVAPSVDVLL